MHHEQQVVSPQVTEAVQRDRPRSHRRIAHQHAAACNTLDHHEVPIAALAQQHDGGKILLLELFERLFESVGLETARLQVLLHVEHRESVLADLGLVAVLEHLRKHFALGDRHAVVMREQRRDGCRSAAEVVLLPNRRSEARFLHAGDARGKAAVARPAYFHRRGLCHRHEARQDPRDTSHGSSNCTFTIVALWISTLAPVFCTTENTPLALSNEPFWMLLAPVMTFVAVLSVTSPSMLTLLWTWVSSPPRCSSSVVEDTGVPSVAGSSQTPRVGIARTMTNAIVR